LALSASDYYKITRSSVMLQKQNNQAVSSSSLFLSVAAASRTSRSSRSRSVIRCSFSSACRSWSARPLALSASDYYKITRSLVMLQKQNNQAVIIHHMQLTMSALLMVTMLVCKARMPSLSSNQLIDVATSGSKLTMEVPVRRTLLDLPAPGRSEAGPRPRPSPHQVQP
jgi:hypothetical protein